MKLVSEALEDVLVGKSQEEVVLIEKAVIDNFLNAVSRVEDIIYQIKENNNREHVRYLYEDAQSELFESFYKLPEYLQDKYDHILADIHHRLDVAGGTALARLSGLSGLSESMSEIIMEQKKLALAAGFVIIQDNKILLEHPTNAKWYESFSIPKGHLEPGEDFLHAAQRETLEEVGLDINPDDITSGPHFVDYIDKGGNLYKRVYYFIVEPSIKIKQKHLKLQKSEIDWAGFLSKKDAKKRIHHRFKEVLKYLK